MKPDKKNGIKKSSLFHDGAYWYFPHWKTRDAPTHAETETPWCLKTRKAMDISDAPIINRRGGFGFGKYRCPDCGRLLQLMTVDIEQGYGDFWPYIPPHKRKHLETIKRKAHERRKRKCK